MSVRRIVSLFNQGQDHSNGGTNDTTDTGGNREDEPPRETEGQGQSEEAESPAERTFLDPIRSMIWRINNDTPEPPETDKMDIDTHDTSIPPTINGQSRRPPEPEPPSAIGFWTPTESGSLSNDSDIQFQTNGNSMGPNRTNVNGNVRNTDDNGIMRTNGNGISPSKETDEDIYARPPSLPRPATTSAGNSQRRRIYTAVSVPIINQRLQRSTEINEKTSLNRSEMTPAEIGSKIPRPSGAWRTKIPNVTPDSIRSIRSVSTLPPYSPLTGPVKEPRGYHETDPNLPGKEPLTRRNDNLIEKFKEIGLGPQRGIEYYLDNDLPSSHQGQNSIYAPLTWNAADISDLDNRLSVTDTLPKINTGFPRMVYDGTSSLPENESTPSSADRIKDLEFEVSSLRETLKSTQEQLRKDAAKALSPTATADRLHEYLKPDEDESSPTKKVSAIRVTPFIRAKKIIVILDATNSGTVRPMSVGKLDHDTRIPRTVLKRISDCLTAQHKETHKRQQVFYLSGCGTGEEFGLNKSLHTTILDAYTYLSDNWDLGDELFLFGFSRGAFAIRAIAALITEIGLLNKAGMTHFEALYDTYFDPRYGKCRSTDEYEKWRGQCTSLAWNLSQLEGITITKVPVKFLGCLETIGWSNYEMEPSEKRQDAKKLWERGVFDFRHLLIHETIENAFHALALDEDRITHSPLLMFRPGNSIKPLTQVWFTGSHVNIGGGQLIVEAGKNVSHRTTDQNELSDIVFLFLITECHEFLSFSKTYVNKAVSDYMSLTPNFVKEINFKHHWVSARIDELGSDAGKAKVFNRIRNATGNRKKHIRTPLRYRPHWFDWEPWSRYKSCEAIHVSSQYRTKYYPNYIPKALLDYRCTKTFEKFGVIRDPSENAPGETSVLRYNAPKTREDTFYYAGQENKKGKAHPNNMVLPVVKLSAFEVLLAGGDTLIFGFGLAFRDIYRESPPVFRYSINELTGMQEDWILRVEPQPLKQMLSPTSMADRTIALRNTQSVPTSLKYQHYVIKQESPYSSVNGNSRVTSGAQQRSVSATAGLPSTQGESPDTQEQPPPLPLARRLNTAQSSANLQHPVPESSTPFSYIKTPQLEDESGDGKGKGLHSAHTNHQQGNGRAIGSSQGPKGYDGTDEREPGPEGNPEPMEQKSKMGSVRKLFSFSTLRRKKKNPEASKSEPKRPRVGQIDGQNDCDSDRPTDGPSDPDRAELEVRKREDAKREHAEWLETFDHSQLVLPNIDEPEWMKLLRQGRGKVQPCKFKHHRNRDHGHGSCHRHKEDHNDENDDDYEYYECGHRRKRDS
ncbi:hypothetical protein TWF106_009477 [Orbilia oligospora]|uniref:T6SS Phospholipase effector Tle1-like catalytic domain-containing protein n=1 Tax=Orbilia oligospora TaxID=2813651 RepID=A0A7C8QLY3_ORBOL|nr:hypothetical protein TWF106_009477 [Orbilia oligospora]KAF3215090.1 hypothetical protein TWF191_009383 [Orbilia oligospora]